MNTFKFIADVINNNKRNRKIVMRYRHNSFEKELAKYNIKIDFYISKNSSRINNIDCFSDNILNGNSNKFFLILSPEAKWNKYDDLIYKKYGYKENIDYIWFSLSNKKLNIDKCMENCDVYGNKIYSLSKFLIETNGYCNNIKIGGGYIIHLIV